MKTMMKKLLAGVAVAASLFSLSAPASATLTDWYLNTNGTGVGSAVQVKDYLDTTGIAFVSNTFTSASTFNFQEVASFNVLTTDGGPPNGNLLAPPLTAQFVGTGSGTIGGNLTFATGTLNVFAGLTDIGTFVLEAGSTTLNAGGVLPNGTISLIFKSTSLAAGYFFDQLGNDLSTLGAVFGFSTTNVITQNGASGPVATSLIDSFNSAFGPTFTNPYSANGTDTLYFSNNGQFRLAVPEPSMLSLFGIALLGLGFLTRRKFQS